MYLDLSWSGIYYMICYYWENSCRFTFSFYSIMEEIIKNKKQILFSICFCDLHKKKKH
jgi:hypothetical protein